MERLFNLDAQLLADTGLLAINVFILFIFLSYMLFNPTRKLLEARKNKVRNDQDIATKEKEDAISLKESYETKLKDINKEAETILSNARKQALKNEAKIIEEAKLEASRIIERANNEVELEKKRVVDEMKQEMIAIASLMAGKVVANAIDTNVHDTLIEETIKEMGDNTWLS
ncbi:F0F1 ATP synthase subunit B [Candidatus Galacturonibacter soehngenii]|uniref:ATP synthase subunit b n=1 Tax=Candidatus Galacturonatibacter soehngenii TaxID=2307010 RepID=A0A7V7QL46_9FIRM|nr:F0F1 ATP synthase subunit B [Candidatus Galacturonibacter soehngenii]KAB1438587.1 F0F1 ATP synthase subunit B [Candidatus Galacturonibacter soehngenii]MBA4685618.1 F0F1 ATP synthase subunit B [Candidatus Galacturonibacter soehngenii]